MSSLTEREVHLGCYEGRERARVMARWRIWERPASEPKRRVKRLPTRGVICDTGIVIITGRELCQEFFKVFFWKLLRTPFGAVQFVSPCGWKRSAHLQLDVRTMGLGLPGDLKRSAFGQQLPRRAGIAQAIHESWVSRCVTPNR